MPEQLIDGGVVKLPRLTQETFVENLFTIEEFQEITGGQFVCVQGGWLFHPLSLEDSGLGIDPKVQRGAVFLDRVIHDRYPEPLRPKFSPGSIKSFSAMLSVVASEEETKRLTAMAKKIRKTSIAEHLQNVNETISLVGDTYIIAIPSRKERTPELEIRIGQLVSCLQIKFLPEKLYGYGGEKSDTTFEIEGKAGSRYATNPAKDMYWPRVLVGINALMPNVDEVRRKSVAGVFRFKSLYS